MAIHFVQPARTVIMKRMPLIATEPNESHCFLYHRLGIMCVGISFKGRADTDDLNYLE